MFHYSTISEKMCSFFLILRKGIRGLVIAPLEDRSTILTRRDTSNRHEFVGKNFQIQSCELTKSYKIKPKFVLLIGKSSCPQPSPQPPSISNIVNMQKGGRFKSKTYRQVLNYVPNFGSKFANVAAIRIKSLILCFISFENFFPYFFSSNRSR